MADLSPDAMALTVEQQRELIDTLVADNLLAPSLGKRWLAALREQAAEIARLTSIKEDAQADALHYKAERDGLQVLLAQANRAVNELADQRDALAARVRESIHVAYRYDDKPHQMWNQLRRTAEDMGMSQEAAQFDAWYGDVPLAADAELGRAVRWYYENYPVTEWTTLDSMLTANRAYRASQPEKDNG